MFCLKEVNFLLQKLDEHWAVQTIILCLKIWISCFWNLTIIRFRFIACWNEHYIPLLHNLIKLHFWGLCVDGVILAWRNLVWITWIQSVVKLYFRKLCVADFFLWNLHITNLILRRNMSCVCSMVMIDMSSMWTAKCVYFLHTFYWEIMILCVLVRQILHWCLNIFIIL